jgi:hypothetical protein
MEPQGERAWRLFCTTGRERATAALFDFDLVFHRIELVELFVCQRIRDRCFLVEREHGQKKQDTDGQPERGEKRFGMFHATVLS